MSTINDIKESYKKGKLIPFIGSGFTTNIDDYPQWYDFIMILENDLRDNFSINANLLSIFKNNYLEATEYYVWASGNFLLTKGYAKSRPHDPFIEGKLQLLGKLKELLSKQKYDASNSLINKFRDTIYTTNWDDTLEKAHDSNLPPIYKLENFRTVDKGPFIIKFHGHYEDYTAESLIACETDYLKRISEENPFDIKLKNDLLHKNFLFIGYSF